MENGRERDPYPLKCSFRAQACNRFYNLIVTRISSAQQNLIDRFVASFEKLDEMTINEAFSPLASQFAIGDADQYGLKRWCPIKVPTALSELELLYSSLPARFPPLFEHLVLQYRWAEVDLRFYRLLANPPGEDLRGLLHEMSKDSGLWKVLLPGGHIQFGRGPDVDYDPVCFDIKSRNKNGDCRIVKIDHEEILCNYRIKIVEELASSFEMLMTETIRIAALT